MHHPPVESGIEWMNTHPDEPWVHRFTEVVRRHDQVRGLICGHLHRAVTVAWEGRTIAICSSTAPQDSLDLRPIDENNPDDRPMIVTDDPDYALHHWNGSELGSIYDQAGHHQLEHNTDRRPNTTGSKGRREEKESERK